MLEMSQNYLSCILSNEYIHSCVFLDGMEAMISVLAPCLCSNSAALSTCVSEYTGGPKLL